MFHVVVFGGTNGGAVNDFFFTEEEAWAKAKQLVEQRGLDCRVYVLKELGSCWMSGANFVKDTYSVSKIKEGGQ